MTPVERQQRRLQALMQQQQLLVGMYNYWGGRYAEACGGDEEAEHYSSDATVARLAQSMVGAALRGEEKVEPMEGDPQP